MVKYNIYYDKLEPFIGAIVFLLFTGTTCYCTYIVIKSQNTIGYNSVLSFKSEIKKYRKTCSATYYYLGSDDNEYKCKNFLQTSDCPEQTTIYYKSNNISKCKTAVDKKEGKLYIIGVCLGFLLVIIGIFAIISKIKEIKKFRRLMTNGTLFKNIPCEIIKTDIKNKKGKVLKKIKAVHNVGWTSKEFQSKPMVIDEEKNTCDLLVDLNDIDNYAIQFEIKEIKGGEEFQGEMANMGNIGNNINDGGNYAPPMDLHNSNGETNDNQMVRFNYFK